MRTVGWQADIGQKSKVPKYMFLIAYFNIWVMGDQRISFFLYIDIICLVNEPSKLDTQQEISPNLTVLLYKIDQIGSQKLQ